MTSPNTKPLRDGAPGYLRIATEEAFVTSELLQRYQTMLDRNEIDDPGFRSLWGFYGSNPSPRARFVLERLQDLGEMRLADMDERGIDRQIIALTSPGVQVLPAAEGTALAISANDQLAEACRKHPNRFTGMVAVAPQDPEAAAREIERGVQKLDMRAVIINSHIQGEYLDAPKFAPVLEAAEALDVPIYLHPNTPPKAMIAPFVEMGLDGAIFGFGVETGFHAMRMITSGVFDRLPRLQVILGHMGEALPFWQYRLDYMHRATVNSGRYACMKPLERKPSEVLRQNFHITNSGMAWAPAIKFTQETIGRDRTLYAMDYPYQCDVEEVTTLDAMDMSLADKKIFFQTNAERLFKLA
ncbi:amidohydrolase family protein [Cupriavidus sp. 8B]